PDYLKSQERMIRTIPRSGKVLPLQTRRIDWTQAAAPSPRKAAWVLFLLPLSNAGSSPQDRLGCVLHRPRYGGAPAGAVRCRARPVAGAAPRIPPGATPG